MCWSKIETSFSRDHLHARRTEIVTEAKQKVGIIPQSDSLANRSVNAVQVDDMSPVEYLI